MKSDNRLVCSCKKVTYADIRKAQIDKEIFTLKEIKNETKAGTACCSCIPDVEIILDTVCNCNSISYKTILKAIKEGADTVDEIEKVTTAGKICGTCKPLIQSMITSLKK